MPRKKSESKPIKSTKPKTTRKKKNLVENLVETAPSIDAVIVAPRLFICDGKKKRFAEKQIKE